MSSSKGGWRQVVRVGKVEKGAMNMVEGCAESNVRVGGGGEESRSRRGRDQRRDGK